MYQMDDGTQVSKFLLEPAYLRELYLFELATTIALLRENVSLKQAVEFTTACDTNANLDNFDQVQALVSCGSASAFSGMTRKSKGKKCKNIKIKLVGSAPTE